MGFAINPSLNHLDIPQNYILEIHQSTAEVVLPDARFRGHPCEAYICISKVEKEMKAYVALLNNALKITLVYTSDYVATTPQEYPKVLAEAEEFVKSMGFTMQKINLDFSPAMREVIIKGLRVMRPPAPQKRLPVRPLKIDVPPELVITTGMDEAPPSEAGNDDISAITELFSLKAELASVRAALAQVTRERVAAEQQSAGERGALKAACEQAMESKRLAEERLAQAVRQLKKLGQAAPLPQDNSELQLLRQQLDQSLTAASVAQRAREQLQTELQYERDRFVRLEEEKNLLAQRLAGDTERLSALRAESAAMKSQLESQLASALATGAAAAEKMATMTGFEQAWREAQQREEALRRQLAAVVEEQSATGSELESLRLQLAQGVELRQQLALMEEALATARVEMAELLEFKKRAEEGRESLAGTVAELVVAREQLAESAAEIERLRPEQKRAKELQQQVECAAGELDTLRQELAAERSSRIQIDDLQQRLTAAETELTTARAEIGRLESMPVTGIAAADRSAAEKLAKLAEEKDAVEAEYVRLATESRETVAALSERISVAEAERERLASELEIQGQVAAMEQAALRAELRRLIVEGAAALYSTASTLAAQEATPISPVNAPSPLSVVPVPAALAKLPVVASDPQILEDLVEIETETEDDGPDAHIVSDFAIPQEFISDFGGFYAGGGASSTEFRIDSSIDMIRYKDPAEVLAVFYSSNTVQAVPDGKGIQRCKGYIVAMKCAASYLVYVAWYLTENGRVVVCLPDQQPEDGEECVQVLKDAISYFEIVGFMMEIVDLGSTRHSYRKALKKIPVLKETAAAE